MSHAPTWFPTDPDAGLPAVTRLPAGSRVVGGRWAIVATNRVLWVLDGERAGRLGLLGPWTVAGLDDGVLAWSAGGVDVWCGPEGVSVNPDPRVRRGRDTVLRREPGGPWSVDGGPELPYGARFASTCRPLPGGRGVAWCDAGFAYTWSFVGGPRVLGRGDALHLEQGAFRAGPGPVPSPADAPELPADAERQRTRVGGLSVVGFRVEGDRVRGWARDGTEVVDRTQGQPGP